MRFSKGLINLHGLCRGRLRLREYLFGRPIARQCKRSTSISQSDKGQRVTLFSSIAWLKKPMLFVISVGVTLLK